MSGHANIRILLTGKNGQLGSELCRLLPGLGEVVSFGRAELDLTNPDAIRRAVRDARPRLIVNAAAYTKVDQAEKEESVAFAVNAEAPALLAEEAKKIGAALVHYSTDYVFDGTKNAPYVESDPPNPLSVYGRSKLAGEEAIRASGAPHLILRTAWVYATSGHNFLLTILRLSTQREELRVVCDQFGAPTWSREIAAGTVCILSLLANPSRNSDSLATASGTYHMTAGGKTSWCHFAEAILGESSHAVRNASWFVAATNGLPQLTRRVTPITSAEYPTPASRPAYSVLSNERLRTTFGFQLPDWRTQLRAVFESS
jgi:dTDP-4-dehydrorhamnose reductase